MTSQTRWALKLGLSLCVSLGAVTTSLAQDANQIFMDVMMLSTKPVTQDIVDDLLSKYPDLAKAPMAAGAQQSPIDSVLHACIMPTSGVCSNDILDQIVAAGANVNNTSLNDSSPLGMAVTMANIYYGRSGELTGSAQQQASLANINATREDYLRGIRHLLSLGADPDGRTMGGEPALYYAAELGTDFVSALLDAGADRTAAIEMIERDLAVAREVQTLINEQ